MAEGEAPTRTSIDELFDGARSAVIRARAPMTIDPAKGPVLLEVKAEELALLRDTLRIIESDERFHCMCKGDYAIELRGRLLSKGMVSFHHGISVRLAGWISDAKLEDGPALFRFLAERGIEEPLRLYEAGLVADQERNHQRERWTNGVPAALRATFDRLERDQSGPRLEAALEALGGDSAAARELFQWLALGQGPWSGYPAYESLPLKLLGAMPAGPLVEAAGLDLSDAEVKGATRYFGSHDVVSFRKSLLGELPPALFDRARPLWKAALPADDVEDVMHRFEHMVRLAADTRESKTRRAPYRHGACLVFGESVDGPLSGLAALADGTLVSVDVKRILRFLPGTVAGVLVAEASEHFVVLGAADDRIVWATMNAGEVHQQRGKRPVERIAAGQRVPVELTVSGENTAWISRDAPGGNQITTPAGPLAQVSGIHSLVSDHEHVYFFHGGFAGGTIERVAWVGGAVEEVCSVPDMQYSAMGTPMLASSRGEMLLGVKKELRAYDLHTGKSRVLLKTPLPIRAVAADSERIVLLIGDEDEDWFFAAAPRDGGAVEKLASFPRAPYHRHRLVIARDHAITVSNDRLIATPLHSTG